jgi:hypothetical protein
MANDERKRWLDRLDRLTYDGTMDISRFLTTFDQYRSKLLTMDPPEEEEILFTFFQDALKNTSPPPQRGVDGERYIGPATWLDRQPISEVDTYEKLCNKLRAKFSRAATRDKDQVMRELRRMTFHMSKTTVKEFAEAWEETVGFLELDELLRMETFMQKMPYVILDEFQRLGNRYKWRNKTWQWLKEALIEADEEIRNPDPVFRRYWKDIREPGSHSDIYKDPEESAKRKRRMADELAKVNRVREQLKAQNNQLREGSERWTNSRESLRIAKGIPAAPEDKKSVAVIGSVFDSGSEGRRNDLPGSVYPQPRLRRRELEREPERRNVEPWLRTARVPVPLKELSKTEPVGSQIKRQLFSSPERPPPERQDHDVKEEAKVELQPEAEKKKEAKPEVAEPKAEETPAVPEEPKEEATSKEPVAVEETPVVEETPKAEETSAPDVSEPVHDELQETDTAAAVFGPVDGPIAEPAKETEEFAQSSGARESTNDGQYVQLPARLPASKVFIIKRFNRCRLDVKQFLPTLDDTLLENFRTEDRKLGLAPGPEPPPCTTLADSEELYQVDVDITVKTSAGSRDDRSLHISTPTVHSAVTIHCKMVEANGKHVASEYEIIRLGPGPEPPPEHDVRSLDFGRVKLTFFMIDSWRTSACNYWPQKANSRGPQHSMIPYYVDKPDPDPEPPPGCLNSSPDGEDQGVGPEEGCSLHGMFVSLMVYSKVRPYNLRVWWGMRRRDGKGNGHGKGKG